LMHRNENYLLTDCLLTLHFLLEYANGRRVTVGPTLLSAYQGSICRKSSGGGPSPPLPSLSPPLPSLFPFPSLPFPSPPSLSPPLPPFSLFLPFPSPTPSPFLFPPFPLPPPSLLFPSLPLEVAPLKSS